MNITAHFAQLPDPRGQSNGLRHRLLDILLIALCAVLCGAENFTDMEEFGEAKEEWLRDRLELELPYGVPSHDTFGRVFAQLDTTAFTDCFLRWTQEIQLLTQGQVIALDGKTLRHSFDSASGKAALHVVSAWANQSRLVLGQVAVDDKSNEMKAVPELLALLDIQGCVVTVDAHNAQKEIAAQVVKQKGDYLFALKSNHPHFYEDVVSYFDFGLKQVAKHAASRSGFHSMADTKNYGHGRCEKRRCWLVDTQAENGIMDWAPLRAQWPSLASIILIESERRVSLNLPEDQGCEGNTRWSEPTFERRYYFSSLKPDPDRRLANRVLHAVREHWGIENSLHWVLDVVFDEDASRIRKDNAPINLATLRHLTLNLLRLDTTHKRGLKSKRLRAGWDHDFLLQLLAGPQS